ncbi:MAG: phage major capsid protein [Clostridia bacterium]|jgi:HK97 family phage major capsid protein|nr:phage major capsid protein [Clostridia bacterium]
MKKSTELRKELDGIMNSIDALKAENKVQEVRAELEKAMNLKQEIALQEQIEREELENFEGEEILNKTTKPNDTVAFNKAVLGKGLTEAENALVERVGEDGGFLVPVEQKTQINELKRALIPLKPYCNVVPVGSLSGSMPLEVEANDELVDFGEITEINQSTIKFGQVKWELKDKGDIIPIANTLLQDEKANLTNYVGRRFAKKAVRSENKDILAALATATKVTGASYIDIETVLNKNLDPAIAAAAVIITDQDGFDYLDKAEGKDGKRILTQDLTDATKKAFKGKRIEVVPNGSITKTAGKLVFYVGDIAEFITFFDREAYEMAVSKEAGFTKNATFMRVIERYDVKTVDTKAVVKVELTPVVA